MIKIVIICFFIAILYHLAHALYFLLKEGKQNAAKTARSLTYRIGLSLLLFILLILGFLLGLIQPHPLLP